MSLGTLRPVLLVCSLAGVGACTPLLGGDVLCSDDARCPAERPVCGDDGVCHADVSEGEGEAGEGEGEAGEGEGEGEAFRVDDVVVEPAVLFADRAATVSFTAPGATACTLELDALPRVPQALSTEELAAGALSFVASRAEVDAAVVGTMPVFAGGAPRAFVVVRVRCTRGAEVAEGLAAVELDRALFVEIASSDDGAEVCWQSAGDSCFIERGPLEPIEGAGSGCFDAADLEGLSNGVDVTATCFDSTGLAAVDVLDRGAALTAAPAALAAPGAVLVTWDDAAQAACTLFANDVEVAAATAGALSLDVDTDVRLRLACEDAEDNVTERIVDVPVGPRVAPFLPLLNRGEVALDWQSLMLTSCAVNTSSGARVRGEQNLPPSGASAFNFTSDPAVGETQVALTCSGFAGDVTETLVMPDFEPAAITDFQLDTPFVSPDLGGDVTVRWATAHATSCTIGVRFDVFDVAPSGTLTFPLPPAGDAGDAIELHCTNDANDTAATALVETVEEDGARLHVSPAFLASPGLTTVSVRAGVGAASYDCALADEDGAVASFFGDGDAEVTVAEDHRFTATCTRNGVSLGTQSADVLVGPRIASLSGRGTLNHVSVAWEAKGATGCALSATNANETVTLDNLASASARQAQARERNFPAEANRLRVFMPLAGGGDTTLTLTCETEGGAQLSRTAVVPEPQTAEVTSFIVTPSDLPEAGGSVDACWTTIGAETCGAFVDGVELLDLPVNGCLSDGPTAVPAFTSTSAGVIGLCCTGAFGGACREEVVAIGPTIKSFAADAFAVAAPSTVTLSWQAAQVDACALTNDQGAAVGAGLAGVESVLVAANTTFTLTCGAGGETLVQSLDVFVGAQIVELSFGTVAHDGYQLTFLPLFIDTKTCTLRGTGEDGFVVNLDGARGGGNFESFFDFDAHGDLTVTATCGEGANVFTASAFAATPPLPPHFNSFVVTPPALPASGGTTEVCWDVVDADACTLRASVLVDGQFVVPLVGCQELTFSALSAGTSAVNEPITVECTNSVGSKNRSRDFLVGAGIVSFGANRAQAFLDVDPTVTLTWETQGTASCAIQRFPTLIGGPPPTPVAPSGSLTVDLTGVDLARQDFHLVCLIDDVGETQAIVSVDLF